MQNFHWSPGIGDPTIGGWVTVALYALAAISTFKTFRVVIDGGENTLWRAMFLLLVLLGINKQLDLQSAITELGRVLASEEGWYDERRTVQLWFVLGVAAVCLALAIMLLGLARNAPLATWIALSGMTVLLAFVLIRAASFHHIDRFIGDRILGLKWNWILEMGGISIVLLSSEWRQRGWKQTETMRVSGAKK
jgi:hypothetical protein